MTLLYSSPVFLEHITGAHPEHPRRLMAISDRLKTTGLAARCSQPDFIAARIDQVERVHQTHYIDHLRRYAAAGGGRIEVDTVVSEKSYDVALMAAGAACDAIARVLRGEDKTALCLVRPPGHHARPHDAMGFCLYNSIAVAARSAIDDHGLDRVLIVDWDVHHGNGTQETFWEDGRVGFLSIHRWPFYPGTGDADEIGASNGLGCIANVPVQFGTPVAEFHARFEHALTDLSSKIKPQLVLISAGFDAHREDPIGSLELETDDFIRLTKTVMAVANQYAEGRVVSLLEGGYNPSRLAECVGVHLNELLSH
jgi:acetoin utilization deacetylase AcuC-like enzyme